MALGEPRDSNLYSQLSAKSELEIRS